MSSHQTVSDDWRAYHWLKSVQYGPQAGNDTVAWQLGPQADPGALLALALELCGRVQQTLTLDAAGLTAQPGGPAAPLIRQAASTAEAREALAQFIAGDGLGLARTALFLAPDDAILALRVSRAAGDDEWLCRALTGLAVGPPQTADSPSTTPVLSRRPLKWMARTAPAGGPANVACGTLPLRSDQGDDDLLRRAACALRGAMAELGWQGSATDVQIVHRPATVLARSAAGCTGPDDRLAAAPVVVGLLACGPALAHAPQARRLPLPPPSDPFGPAILMGLRPTGQTAEVELSCAATLSPGLAELLLDRVMAGWDAASAGDGAEDTEALILTAFREALGKPAMTADDDFFDCGGHSLTATRIVGRLASQHGITIRFEDVFAHPTARRLAARAIRDSGPAPAPAPAQDRIESPPAEAPLSLAQASLWKIYAALNKGAAFNIPFALRFLDPVDEDAFAAAFRDLLVRHDILRSLFVETDLGVRQRVLPMDKVDRLNWFHDRAGGTRQDEAAHIFDLSAELPVRLRFFTEDAQQVLSLVFHHIILDEWSVDLLMNDLATAYLARSGGRTPDWPDQPPAFADFARRQTLAGPGGDDLHYWVSRLWNAPPRRAFTPPGGAAPTGTGGISGGWREITLPLAVADGLRTLARVCGASLFNIVYAAIAAALRQVSGQDDLVIGTSASGRSDPAFFDTVGYFTTVVAHRLRIAAEATPAALTMQVRDMINASLPHDSIPIDLVEAALDHPGPEHIFELFIQIHAGNRLNGALRSADGREISFRQIDPEKSESVLGLQFEAVEDVVDETRPLRIMMSYRSDYYTPADVDRIDSAVAAMMARFADPARADAGIPAGRA